MYRVILLAALVACSGGGGGGGGAVSIDALFPAFLDALCTEQAACGAEPDKATCIADRNVKETDILTVIADVKAGTIGYDAAGAGACLDELRTATCDNLAPRATPDDDPLFCIFGLFTGTVAKGASCNSEFECVNTGSVLDVACQATDTQCDPGTACCASTCVNLTAAPGTGAVGAACSGTAPCLPSLYCSDVTQTCKQPGAAVGDACESFDGCDAPLTCNQTTQPAGTCAALVATGGACTTGADCVDVRDFCDPTAMKCTRKVAVGGDCTSSQCVDFASCTTATCVERAKIGEACGTSGPSCLSNLHCVNSVCAVAPDGTVCP